MSRSSRVIVAAFAFLAGVGVLAGAAVPDREAPPNPYAVPTVKLNALEKNAGAIFGEWTVWRHDFGGAAIVLIHQPSGQVIYMPWSSNGWLNFRTAAGAWNVLYSNGQPSLQNREDLQIARHLGRRPERALEAGEYSFERWIVTVTPASLEFRNTAPHHDRMTIRAGSPQFIHNGRSLGGAP